MDQAMPPSTDGQKLDGHIPARKKLLGDLEAQLQTGKEEVVRIERMIEELKTRIDASDSCVPAP